MEASPGSTAEFPHTCLLAPRACSVKTHPHVCCLLVGLGLTVGNEGLGCISHPSQGLQILPLPFESNTDSLLLKPFMSPNPRKFFRFLSIVL